MREFAKTFYTSQAWRDCRKAYRKAAGGLCERCYKAGRLTPGEIVHHKIELTPQNICDPDVTLNWDNLMLVCRDCHADIHSKAHGRYVVDETGKVITI